MRDHRADQLREAVDITEQLRRVGRNNSAVRVTPPDWRLGRAPRPPAAKIKKARRRQADQSRKKNRT